MDANTTSLIFLMLFVVCFVMDSWLLEDPASGEASELHAADRYAVADRIV